MLNTFGKRLRELRKERELRQEDLTEAINKYGADVGRTYISILENSEDMPNLRVAAAIARVLECSVEYLALMTDDPAPLEKIQPQAHYITPEADEVASIMDRLPLQKRNELAALARTMAQSLTQQERDAADYTTTLESIERNHGLLARQNIENAMRSNGIMRTSR